jgi:hypothetical protein
MKTNRRNVLKSLATGAAVLPLSAALENKLLAQGDSAAPAFAPTTVGPAGVAAFINAAKAAARTSPQALAEVFQGADSDFDPAGYTVRGFSEASPLVLIRESVQMNTPTVAMIDAEIGRFQTVGGWQGVLAWIVLERRGLGAKETWKPVLVRTFPAAPAFPISIFGTPRQQLL